MSTKEARLEGLPLLEKVWELKCNFFFVSGNNPEYLIVDRETYVDLVMHRKGGTAFENIKLEIQYNNTVYDLEILTLARFTPDGSQLIRVI